VVSPRTQPLNGEEEALWRAFTFVMTQLPRALDADLQRQAHMSVSDYGVLVHLSESKEGLVLSQLAQTINLSLSRVSRLVDAMVERGEVTKRPSGDDARCVLVEITPTGLAALRAAYPTQLANIRAAVFDQLDRGEIVAITSGLAKIKAGLERSSTSS
jgi:DNA-binding MarR family transcriptional regulator